METTHQTIKFVSDEGGKEIGLADEFADLSDIQNSRKDGRKHSLEDILGRPQRLNSGSWSITHTGGQILSDVALPAGLLNGYVAEKLKGFLSFKATFCVKIVLNAQKFQQGRLCLSYCPEKARVDGRKAKWDENMITRTQRPRVDIDPAVDSDVTFRIPYINKELAMNIADGGGPGGIVEMWVYSPLVSPSGSTTVPFTMYGWFEDVDLQYPTYTSQALGDVKRNQNDPTIQESRRSGAGTISSLSQGISLLKGISPLLSSATFVPPWAQVVAKGAAMAFGFSKPISEHMVSKVEVGGTPNLNNSDGTCMARNMGLISNNGVKRLPGFAGQNVDEMSINYLCCIPSYARQFNWTMNQSVGTTLNTLPVNPRTYSATLGTPEIGYHSPMAYFSHFFSLWRGSITFHFKVVKTTFHSGRLVVAWVPGRTTAVELGGIGQCYQEVLDLREATEITLTIPYVNTRSYSRMSEATGSVQVYVLNPLVGPDTVSGAVTVLVEVCGGEDLEFAFPTSPGILPLAPNSVYTAQGLEDTDDEEGLRVMEKIHYGVGVSGYGGQKVRVSSINTALTLSKNRAEILKMAMELDVLNSGEASVEYMKACLVVCSSLYPFPFMNGWGGFSTYDESGKLCDKCSAEDYMLWLFKETGKSVASIMTSIPPIVHANKNKSPKSPRRKKPSGGSLHTDVIYTAQALGDDICEESATIMTSSDELPSSKNPGVSHAEVCIGEKILSLRSLMKRMVPWANIGVSLSETIFLRHFMISGIELNGATIDRSFGIDYVNYFLPMFALWRGSVRYAFYYDASTAINTHMRVTYRQRTSSDAIDVSSRYAASTMGDVRMLTCNVAQSHMVSGGSIEVQIPFYSRTAAKDVEINTITNEALLEDGVIMYRGAAARVTVCRGIGEDFDCGLFLGTPVTVRTGSLVIPGGIGPIW